MNFVLVLSAFVFSALNGCKQNPVDAKPENRSPVILSLTVFPDVVKPSDSLIVVCNATDPDGDTLVYDWYTSGIVRIKGLRDWDCCAIFNTHENSQIFFAPDSVHISGPQDTLWVQCAARDRKGGMDVKLIHFIVEQN